MPYLLKLENKSLGNQKYHLVFYQKSNHLLVKVSFASCNRWVCTSMIADIHCQTIHNPVDTGRKLNVPNVLVLFLQFTNVKHPYSVTFSKVADWNTLRWVFYTFLRFFKLYQIAQRIIYDRSIKEDLLFCLYQSFFRIDWN